MRAFDVLRCLCLPLNRHRYHGVSAPLDGFWYDTLPAMCEKLLHKLGQQKIHSLKPSSCIETVLAWMGEACQSRSLAYAADILCMQSFEKVKAVKLVPEEWTPENGLITATSKLKRPALHQRYADEVSQLYSQLSNSTSTNGPQVFSL